MKVLHVIPSVAWVHGGPSQAVLAMVKALREQGIAAEIVTTNDDGVGLLAVPLCQRTQYQRVPVWFFPPLATSLTPLKEFKFSCPLSRWLWQHLAEYDLIHIHAIFSYPSTFAMALARYRHIPYIVRPLGQLCQWSLQQKPRKKQLYLRCVERANLNHSSALHFTSVQEQTESQHLGFHGSSFVLPHGLTLPTSMPTARQALRQRLQIPEDEPVILFLSRLHPKKGLDYLIPALGHLALDHRFTLALAGSGTPAYELEVEKLIESSGICDRTRCLGFVKGELKNILLQGSDLFVLTSHSENFGVAVLEAMAAGLPVVVTPTVALATVVKSHCLGYVTDLNVAAIAATLELCLGSSKQLQEMGNRARQLVKCQYTWEGSVLNLHKIYKAILKQQPIFSFTDSKA